MIGKRIKEQRRKLNLTQADLAEKLGVVKGTVSAWETGNRRPSFEMMNDMCELFQVSLGYLAGSSDDAAPVPTPTDEVAVEWLAQEHEEDADYLNRTLQDVCLGFARMDHYARKALLALFQEEMNRCKEQNTLADPSSFVCAVNIQAVHK